VHSRMSGLFLGMVAQGLKGLGLTRALQETKEFSFTFPEFLETAFATALLSILQGKLDLRLALASLLGDLLIEMTPFGDDLKEKIHEAFDWAILGAAIGAFFGNPLLGAAIGAGVGVLIQLLDEKFKLGINEWFETNLPVIFSTTMLGAAIGSIIPGVGTAIGALAGAIVGALWSVFWPIREEIWDWCESITNEIFNGLERLMEDILSFYVEGVGRFVILPFCEGRASGNA